MKCRHCGAPLRHRFLDLGFAPPSNAYLSAADLVRPETYYPLRVLVCGRCWLVQTEDHARADALFADDYAYLSSTSRSWLDHARRFTAHAIDVFGLGPRSHVVEAASNDGYLLRNFVAAGIPCLGIEPTAGTAALAEAQGIPVLREFFGEALAHRLVAEGRAADLVVGNNVYAHVPDINDFTRGLATLVKPEGAITLEFPHLLRLIEGGQFDTIYHEHFSYLSLGVVMRIFSASGLRVWHVEELSTHGGSLRVYGCRIGASRPVSPAVETILSREAEAGLCDLRTYAAFQARADRIKDDLLAFLIDQKRAGKRIVAYGAAAKGNTLLNYAGVKPDLLAYVCDAAVSKQGKFMPGSHIPIRPPAALRDDRPDCVLILPWNIADEVRAHLREVLGNHVTCATAVPELRIG
jgi:hypothetical protein